MSAYYNENDPFAAEWLRQLIATGAIAPGEVDQRSIVDVKPDDLVGFKQCHFFAGIGVWSYALRLSGWSDDRPVWTGSCPCQPFSTAGKKYGTSDDRHLWPAFHWLIDQCRPDMCLGEQVASKGGLAWLDLVQADLEGTGYASGAVDICAAGVGAPHIRQRLFWFGKRLDGMADDDSLGRGSNAGRSFYNAEYHTQPCRDTIERKRSPTNGFWRDADWLFCSDGKWRPVEPGAFPLAYGAPARVGRLRGYGNAIVAEQAQAFIESLMEVIA